MSPDKTKEQTGLMAIENSGLPAEEVAKLRAEYEKSSQTMLNNVNKQLPLIKIAGAGANVYKFGSEGKSVDSFRGIILEDAWAFAYWYDPTKTIVDFLREETTRDAIEDEKRPLCVSFDSITGSREAEKARVTAGPRKGQEVTCFGRCAKCFLNQFKTAVNEDNSLGRGKACKNGNRVLLLVENQQIPHLLRIAPTSITPYGDYIVSLKNKGKVPWQVWTEFSLELQKSGKMEWSTLKARIASDVEPKLLSQILDFRAQFNDVLHSDIERDEVVDDATQDADLPY